MTAWPIEKEGHPAPSETHPDTNPLRRRRHPRYPSLMQHEIPNFDVDVDPIPIPRDFALQACTLRIDDRARSSPPDSRRLFITGANSGTKSWYLEQRHQLRPSDETTSRRPGEQQGPAATQAGVQERGKAQWGRETRGNIVRRNWWAYFDGRQYHFRDLVGALRS